MGKKNKKKSDPSTESTAAVSLDSEIVASKLIIKPTDSSSESTSAEQTMSAASMEHSTIQEVEGTISPKASTDADVNQKKSKKKKKKKKKKEVMVEESDIEDSGVDSDSENAMSKVRYILFVYTRPMWSNTVAKYRGNIQLITFHYDI